jgi:emfourin
MDDVQVEQFGGFAGFGGAHLKSSGVVNLASLSEADRAAVETLFKRSSKSSPAGHPDQFRYRLTRTTSAGSESVEVAESEVPDALKSSVSAKLE